jgi:hypothetical protein
MEFTEKGIPLSLKPAFQEYDIHQLDPERDAFTIIERTLARGKRDEVRWLFSHFETAQLVAWLQTYGWRSLPRRRLSFWSNYFELHSLPERKNVWPH